MVLYLDCTGGVSGDMLAAALLGLAADAGLDGRAVVEAALVAAGVDPAVVAVERVRRAGFAALRFCVAERPGFATFDELKAAVTGESLPAAVADTVCAVADRMAAAENAVHEAAGGHLHELAGLDTAVDLIAVASLVEAFDPDGIVASPVALGGGRVATAHGSLAVPVPAVVELLKGLPVVGGEHDAGELTTPTGAALLAELAERFGALPDGRLVAAGYGAGSREVEGRANVLRALLVDAAGLPAETTVTPAEGLELLETSIDDMSGELLAHAAGRLRAAGALDVWLTPALMKKGRSGHVLHVLGPTADRARLAGLIFRETTTFGLRVIPVGRLLLDERRESVAITAGRVSVRLGYLDGRLVTASPEYEDCRRLAEAGRLTAREVYEAAQAAARRRFGDARPSGPSGTA